MERAALRLLSALCAGQAAASFPIAELAAAGVKRISLAVSLYLAALTGADAALREILEQGTFGYTGRILTSAELDPILK